MIHVICSRWGEKYNVEYVNKLYSMVKRYLNAEFKFYCQTDQTNGLDSNVNVLPFLNTLPESSPEKMFASNSYLHGLPRLWDRPKLNYFNPDCWGLDGVKIALDIDVIIHNDMKPILDSFKDKPLTARSWWHNMISEADPRWRREHGARNNGGFYMWEGEMFKPIWEDLLRNWKRIYFVFHGGSDNFITTRHLKLFDFLSWEHYYSFNRGVKFPDDLGIHKIRKEKIICAFNVDPGRKINFQLHEAIKLYPEVKELWV